MTLTPVRWSVYLGIQDIATWKENDIAGQFLVTPILENIDKTECLVADITVLNFNVAFEIGYAIGRKKRVVLIRNESLNGDQAVFGQLGLFDTLGYRNYTSAVNIVSIINSVLILNPLTIARRHSGGRPRLFLLEPRSKTHYDIAIKSSIKKSRIGFENYDPSEKGRLPAQYAIDCVSKEDAFVATLLPSSRTDFRIHNVRVAFCAGIAYALGRECLILQESVEPVSLDYRELVRWVSSPDEISQAIGDLALRLYAGQHAEDGPQTTKVVSLLEQITFGSSIAENESQALENYYLKTEQFKAATLGEVQIVTGRKGSGKTAFFIELRNHLRRNPQNIVLDLQPEGFQFLKFKEKCLSLLSGGSREHLLTALWEYVILLEIANRILRDDRGLHLHNHLLNDPYMKLAALMAPDQHGGAFAGDGDFAERLDRILEHVERGLLARMDVSRTDNALSMPVLTELLYTYDLKTLQDLVESYVKHKAGVWILIDNLDKGWPATGLTEDDTRLIRCLQGSLNKIERPMTKHGVTCHGVVFLRSDVYDLLMNSTPDKGKIRRVKLDMTNRDVLREILRLRIAFATGEDNVSLDEMWPKLFVSHIGATAEETCSFLIDRSMMRPRAFLELVGACRSSAVTLQRSKVSEADLHEGLASYSVELASNIGFEIRDVYPTAPDVIFALIGCGRRIARSEVNRLLQDNGVKADELGRFLDLLFWYGVLGLVGKDDIAKYIYDEQYELKKLLAVHFHLQLGADPVYEINPAFWATLEIDSI